MATMALNSENQAPLDAWAADFLAAELALRTASQKMANLMKSCTQFQNDVTLPAGYYGYVTESWQTPLDVGAIDSRGRKWRAERETPEHPSHPYNFSRSLGLVGVAAGKLGEAIVGMRVAHEEAMFELCNFRIIDEGPGK